MVRKKGAVANCEMQLTTALSFFGRKILMNKKELDFAVFCVESVAERLGVNGADIYVKLKHESDLLDAYIVKYYDTLHTQGKEYIVADIIDIMRKEGLIQ